MNILKISLWLITALSTIVACKEEDGLTPTPQKSVIEFTLSSPEYTEKGDNIVSATSAESKIYSLTAVLAKDDVVYSITTPEISESGYSLDISRAGNYTMYIVANGGDDFNAGINSIEEGAPLSSFLELFLRADNETGLQPMTSEPITVSVDDGAYKNIGEIVLTRPTVRIDVINAVEGLDITSFRIVNAVSGRSFGGDEDVSDIQIDGMNKAASFEAPAFYTSSAYIFYNPDTKLELTYTYNGEETGAELIFGDEGVIADMIAGFVLSEEKLGEVTVTKTVVPWSTGYETAFDNPMKDYPVSVALTGSASYPKTHEHAVHPLENECAVLSEYFVFFKDDAFYTVKEGQKYGENMYQTVLNEPGVYTVSILANPSDELLAAVEALEPGVSTIKDYSSIEVTQAPDAENFLMASDLRTLNVQSEDLNPMQRVDLYRKASRIDIINAVDGLEINRVVFNGHASKSLIMGSDGNGMTAEKIYQDEFAGAGNSADYLIFDGIIYTYANTASSHELKIEYTLDGESSSVSVTMPNGKIPQNSLYSVVLQQSSEVIAKVYEEDWTLGYTPVVSVSQAAMNAALAVNHFAEFNVSSIEDSKVEFCTTVNSLPYDKAGASLFAEWDSAFTDAVWTASDGKNYRLPSKAEWMLLVPEEISLNFTKTSASKEGVVEVLPETLFGEHSGGTGTSAYLSVNEKSNPGSTVWYGLRFKGTDQCALYRYECFNCNEPSENAYLAIQIKALPPDTEVSTTDDLFEYVKMLNPSFGEKDYIEITVPLGGSWMFGEQFLIGQCATYWTVEGSSMMITLPSTGYFDGEDTEKGNLKLVRID